VIIPVLDVLGNRVVQAHGGDRRTYPPLRSCLTDSIDPIEVARTLRDQTGATNLYLADLDAIIGESSSRLDYRQLADAVGSVWIDAGIRDIGDAEKIRAAGHVVIVGLETLSAFTVLDGLIRHHGPKSIVFSLDLRAGRPCGIGTNRSIETIVQMAVDAGVERMIVLDIAEVGQSRGPMTLEWCYTIHTAYPLLELSTGGGIRSWADVDKITAVGVSGVLVASALHEGRISPLRSAQKTSSPLATDRREP